MGSGPVISTLVDSVSRMVNVTQWPYNSFYLVSPSVSRINPCPPSRSGSCSHEYFQKLVKKALGVDNSGIRKWQARTHSTITWLIAHTALNTYGEVEKGNKWLPTWIHKPYCIVIARKELYSMKNQPLGFHVIWEATSNFWISSIK